MLRRNFFKLFAGAGIVGISSSAEIKAEQSNKYVLGHSSVACDFAKALGLDPKKTRSIHLNIDVAEPITADVQQYVTLESMDSITAVVNRKYVLTRINSEKDKLVEFGK
jgi:hypothetical protein